MDAVADMLPTRGLEAEPASEAVRLVPAGGRSPSPWVGPGGVVLAVVAGLLVLGGVLLRLWLLGHAPMNSDEATPGLVAHEILHGHTYAFAWGQQYGGVEPYVLAAAFFLFGQSPFVLDATPCLLYTSPSPRD